MAGIYALVEDGTVTNTILWDGPDISTIDFAKGIEAVKVEEGVPVSANIVIYVVHLSPAFF